jgi:hypothetical protein
LSATTETIIINDRKAQEIAYIEPVLTEAQEEQIANQNPLSIPERILDSRFGIEISGKSDTYLAYRTFDSTQLTATRNRKF